MPSSKAKQKKINKISKLINASDTDDDGSDHELSHYVNDRVKLMKEVIKILKPKKIKSMAPDCIKNLDIEEINSMLLEELLGISNKRLVHIFNGENVDGESSSTEEEEENASVDIISLDDISSDDDIVFEGGDENKDKSSKKKHKKHKHKITHKPIKLEKVGKRKQSSKSKDTTTENVLDSDRLMSVLELLELQARARAIRSQLAIATDKPKETPSVEVKEEHDSDPDAVVIESPKKDEIVISSSSDSEEEKTVESDANKEATESVTIEDEPEQVNDAAEEVAENLMAKRQKLRLIRESVKDDSEKKDDSGGNKLVEVDEIEAGEIVDEVEEIVDETEEKVASPAPNVKEQTTERKSSPKVDTESADKSDTEHDTIVIDLDESEVDGIVND